LPDAGTSPVLDTGALVGGRFGRGDAPR